MIRVQSLILASHTQAGGAAPHGDRGHQLTPGVLLPERSVE